MGLVIAVFGSLRKRESALGRNRTCDQEIRRLLLYPLSYEGKEPILLPQGG